MRELKITRCTGEGQGECARRFGSEDLRVLQKKFPGA